MQLARKVPALVGATTLLLCLLLSGNRASGAFIVEFGSATASAFTSKGGVISSYYPLPFDSEYAVYADAVSVMSVAYSALFEGSLMLTWQGDVNDIFQGDKSANGSLSVEFEVDTTEVFRFSGSGEKTAGETHTELRLDDTILAQTGLGIDEPGPLDVTQEVVLSAGQTYTLEVTGSVSQPAGSDSAMITVLLTPVPEPSAAILLGGAAAVLIGHAVRRRLRASRSVAPCRD